MSVARCWKCLGPERDGPDGLCYECRAAIAIEAQRAVTVKQGAVRSTKARVRRTSPQHRPMNTPTHEGDVE